jgi:hypothetical protein
VAVQVLVVVVDSCLPGQFAACGPCPPPFAHVVVVVVVVVSVIPPFSGSSVVVVVVLVFGGRAKAAGTTAASRITAVAAAAAAKAIFAALVLYSPLPPIGRLLLNIVQRVKILTFLTDVCKEEEFRVPIILM